LPKQKRVSRNTPSAGGKRAAKRKKRILGQRRKPSRSTAGETRTRKTSRSGPQVPKQRGRKAVSALKKAKPRTITSDSRIESLRAMLEAKRSEVLQEIKRAREDSVKSDRVSFPEVGDLVSASVEKERAFEYGEIGVNALREIDTALTKLKQGTYGICEVCGKPIGVKRLQVMPSARLCIKCKSKEEASGKIKPAPQSVDDD